MKWDLLEKTELRIEQIILDDANLTDIAAAVPTNSSFAVTK